MEHDAPCIHGSEARNPCSVGDNWEEWREHLHYLDYAVVAAVVVLVVYLIIKRRRGDAIGEEPAGAE